MTPQGLYGGGRRRRAKRAYNVVHTASAAARNFLLTLSFMYGKGVEIDHSFSVSTKKFRCAGFLLRHFYHRRKQRYLAFGPGRPVDKPAAAISELVEMAFNIYMRES